MAVPDYQTLMLPVLKIIFDETECSSNEIINKIIKLFNLSEEEQKEMLPSGTQTLLYNRVGWAKTYLKKAGLIESPKRSFYKITARGTNVIKSSPSRIDIGFLNQFEEFQSFRTKVDNLEENPIMPKEELTDIENLENIIEGLNNQLAQDLLEKILQDTPEKFENLVAELLIKLGYGSSKKDIIQSVGKSGDEGIDGIIKEDVLGLNKIYIQAKRWQGCVGSPEIDKFAGALQKQNATKGVFITTSKFSREALEAAPRYLNSSIILIDGKRLTDLMIEYNLGVETKISYSVKKIDEGYFAED